jgi:hypothetical protein
MRYLKLFTSLTKGDTNNCAMTQTSTFKLEQISRMSSPNIKRSNSSLTSLARQLSKKDLSSGPETSIDTYRRPPNQQVNSHAEGNSGKSSGEPPVKFVYIKYKTPPCTDLRFCRTGGDIAEREDEDSYDYDAEQPDEAEDEGPHMLSWDNDDNIYEDYLDGEDDETTICSIPNDPYLNLKLACSNSTDDLDLNSEISHSRLSRSKSQNGTQHSSIFVNRRPDRRAVSSNSLLWSGPGEVAGQVRGIVTPIVSPRRTTIEASFKQHRRHAIASQDVSRSELTPNKSPKSVIDLFHLPIEKNSKSSRDLISNFRFEDEDQSHLSTIVKTAKSDSNCDPPPLLPKNLMLPGIITCSYDIEDDESFDWNNLEGSV